MLTLTAPDSTAAYIRVSTYDQKTESQREEISRWLKNHGIDPESIRWFEDKETGKNLKRPAFQQLQKAIFAGEIKTVLMWKLDRISRKMLDGLHTMRFWLNHGVGIVSITQQIDMTGPIGQLFAALMFAIAEFQLSTMKENQAAGIALARQRGVYKGRKKGTKKLKPEEIRNLRKTLKVTQIAKLKDVSERTVYSALAETNCRTALKQLTSTHPSIDTLIHPSTYGEAPSKEAYALRRVSESERWEWQDDAGGACRRRRVGSEGEGSFNRH